METLYDYIIKSFILDGQAARRMIDSLVLWACNYYTAPDIDGREILTDEGITFLTEIIGDNIGMERAEIVNNWKEA